MGFASIANKRQPTQPDTCAARLFVDLKANRQQIKDVVRDTTLILFISPAAGSSFRYTSQEALFLPTCLRLSLRASQRFQTSDGHFKIPNILVNLLAVGGPVFPLSQRSPVLCLSLLVHLSALCFELCFLNLDFRKIVFQRFELASPARRH